MTTRMIEGTDFSFKAVKCMYKGGENLYLLFKGHQVGVKLAIAPVWMFELGLSTTAQAIARDASFKVDALLEREAREREVARNALNKSYVAELSKMIEEKAR